MAKFFVSTCLFVVLVCFYAVNAQYYSPVYPAYGYSNAAAAGAAGTQFGQQTGSSETHDKKNFGVNFDSDKGSSNQFSNTNAQVGVAGAGAVNYPYYGHQVPAPVPGGWGPPPPPRPPHGWGRY